VNTIAINGLLHIHSSYSYDGEVSLQQLRDLCKNSGYKFGSVEILFYKFIYIGFPLINLCEVY
jgi:hypothetical protein